MKIPFFLALLLAIGNSICVVGGVFLNIVVPSDIADGTEKTQFQENIDFVQDRNISIIQKNESIVEPWLIEIQSQIKGLGQTITERHHRFEDFIVGSVTEYVEKNSHIIAKMQDIQKIINRINFRYQRMRTYKKRNTFQTATLGSFALSTLMIIDDWINELHDTLFGNEDTPDLTPNFLLIQLHTALKGSPSHMCRTRQSAQQFFYLLHKDIELTELKALALADFSWTLLKKEGEFTEEKILMREEYERRTNRTLRMFKEVISRADRTLWRCDPPHHKSGVTYEEVTRLVQGFIQSELYLSNGDTCRNDCSHYDYSETSRHNDNVRGNLEGCSGRVHKCKFVESTMEVCLAARNSSRRYDFVHYESGQTFGRGGTCNNQKRNAASWQWYLFWSCTYCMCLCDDQNNSDRFFNLRPVIADVEGNRVVTGLRFVKHHRVLHLQIQEGELLPKGVINQTTLQWKPVDEYRPFDKDVRQGVDYHKLAYDRRSIDLNELKPLSSNSLITGLRFQNVKGHLHLEAQYTEFEFQSGKLIEPTEKSYWETGDIEQSSKKLTLGDTQVPTLTTTSMPFPQSYTHMDFSHTGFKQDAGQTTVPFIDIQEVVSNPPVPLAGIGIYYKGSPGYGGFLGTKIINFDMSSYLQ